MSIIKPSRVGGLIGSVPKTVSGVYGLTKLSEIEYPFAIGGDTYTYLQDGQMWRCHMFSQVGSDTLTFLRGGLVEYLVVGGGGAGGSGEGAGGGAGGLRTGAIIVASGAIPVAVGSGGQTSNQSGDDSSFSVVTSAGGGGGASGNAGSSGGSGGGGKGPTYLTGYAGNTPPTSPSQGNSGGDGRNGSGNANSGDGYHGGGGGGASAAGENAPSSTAAGDGGDGLALSISGQSIYYAGGGGGGTDMFRVAAATAGLGGLGGGGNGGHNSAGYPGQENTGGGGGGSSNRINGTTTGIVGGSGGSGIVIVRYPITPQYFEGDEPNYDNVSLLLHMNGSNGSTTFYDSSKHRHTVTANGNAQISTAQSKFGGASAAFDGTGDYLSVADSPLFAMGAGDFTIEMWLYHSGSLTDVDTFYDNRTTSASGTGFQIRENNAGYAVRDGASTLISTVSGRVIGQWQHVAVTRNNSTLRLFVDGVQAGSSVTYTTTHVDETLRLGSEFDGSNPFNGYIDDLRITKGVARYTGNFTPPQREFLP